MSEFNVDSRKTVCPTCMEKSKPVMDHTTGDFICTSCGLVLEGQCLDESQEWRSFASEGVEMGAPQTSRRERGSYGDRPDELLWELDGTTVIGGRDTATAVSLQRAQLMADRATAGTSSKSDRLLKLYVVKVREAAGRLSLSESILQRCVQLLQDLAKRNELHQRMQPAWFSALIYLACREERAGRTIRELAHANAQAAGKKEADFEKQMAKRISQLNKALAHMLNESQTPYIEPEDIMPRFVSRLHLSQVVCAPATYISRQAYRYRLVGSREQCAVVASTIYIVAWLLDIPQKPKFSDVALIAKVPEAAVKSAYHSLRPHVSRLLPESFKCFLVGGAESLPVANARSGAPR